jgi:opacity protein-like surface antigen
MKMFLVAAAMLPLVGLSAAPALAQEDATTRPFTGYANLGYSHSDYGISDLGGATGRIGMRYKRFVGVEAEGTFGIDSDNSTRFGRPTKTELDRAVAAYAVGWAPVMPKLDLFARVGIGNSRTEIKGLAAQPIKFSRDSINYGVGAQYFLTQNDGLRLDLTRADFRHGSGRADTYGLSYVRRF